MTLTKADMEAVSAAWYKQLDPGNAGKVTQAAFANGIVPVATPANQYVGTPGRDNGRGSWTDWDNMIGGWFKFHWLDPQHIVVKIDDKTSPLTKMFAGGQDFDVYDETYTFSINSFSRENVHVLTSINYDKMSFMDRLKESNPRPDHDFGLSWIKTRRPGPRLLHGARPRRAHVRHQADDGAPARGHAVHTRRSEGRRLSEQEEVGRCFRTRQEHTAEERKEKFLLRRRTPFSFLLLISSERMQRDSERC